MKQIKLLIFFVFLHFISTGQVNTDSVTISKRTAQIIAKDLLLIKPLKEENSLLKQEIKNIDSQLLIKDTIISIKEKTISLQSDQLSIQEKQKELTLQEIKRINKKLKWSNTKLHIAGGLIIGLSLLTIFK